MADDLFRRVAIAGNPNTGKTTIFNALTGLRQKVGNYPGVTVEKVSGILKLEHLEVECIDVPGAYSLEPVSEDERVAVDVMVGHGHPAPDLFVYVLDAGNLERNLFMFTQLAELEVSVVVALTMTDVAARRGVKVDAAKLANLLGVDVVPVVGHRGIGVNAVKEAIERNLEAPKPSSPSFGLPIEVETKVAALGERFARSGVDLPKAEIRRALQGAADLTEQTKEIPELAGALREAKEELEGQGVLSASNEVSSRYQWATMVSRAVTLQPQGKKPESPPVLARS